MNDRQKLRLIWKIVKEIFEYEEIGESNVAGKLDVILTICTFEDTGSVWNEE